MHITACALLPVRVRAPLDMRAGSWRWAYPGASTALLHGGMCRHLPARSAPLRKQQGTDVRCMHALTQGLMAPERAEAQAGLGGAAVADMQAVL